MNLLTKISYLILFVFPFLLILIIIMAIVAVGHVAEDPTIEFLLILGFGVLYAPFIGTCIQKPYELRSRKLRFFTKLLTLPIILLSILVFIASFSGPLGQVVTPIMFFVALSTMIAGIVVMIDNRTR